MYDFRTWLIFGLSILCVVLGISTYSYRTTSKANASALKTLEGQVERTNKEASDRYALLEEKSKDQERQLKERAKADGIQDAKDKTTIADDTKRDTAPVSVRYVTRDTGRCSRGTPSQAAPNSGDRPGDAGEASGVLAAKAEELTRRDRDAVESLQLAFNRCKVRLKEELEDANRN
jgi:hypothetical protein